MKKPPELDKNNWLKIPNQNLIAKLRDEETTKLLQQLQTPTGHCQGALYLGELSSVFLPQQEGDYTRIAGEQETDHFWLGYKTVDGLSILGDMKPVIAHVGLNLDTVLMARYEEWHREKHEGNHHLKFINDGGCISSYSTWTRMGGCYTLYSLADDSKLQQDKFFGTMVVLGTGYRDNPHQAYKVIWEDIEVEVPNGNHRIIADRYTDLSSRSKGVSYRKNVCGSSSGFIRQISKWLNKNVRRDKFSPDAWKVYEQYLAQKEYWHSPKN